MTLVDRALDYLNKRTRAYKHTFNVEEVFPRIVMEDLAKFCRAHESTFHKEQSMSDRLDGRREVWLRISHHLNLTDEQLWSIYGNKTLPKE